ncbi:MAG: glucose-6-phosphate isomerase [Planctomycetota bacterium]|nr:glucose-6-phosphate isomerase [Planctomycetota bacterium]
MDRITLDYTNILADAIGAEHGITDAELGALGDATRSALDAVQARRKQDLRWMDLPYQDQVQREVLDYAASVRGRFDNVVVLGIGGSALGNRALHTALNSPYHDIQPPSGVPRLFVLDNVDPDLIGEFLSQFAPSRCLFNVISKSGSTAETMSQFLIVRKQLIEALGREGHKDNLVITTDAAAGNLRPVVEDEGYASFVVPQGVGGRFSVLSPVGLVSSALMEIDVMGLVAGAAKMDERCRAGELFENPAQLYAAIQWAMQAKKGKNIAVTFSYSQRLADLADWYAQLLAESIGKKHATDGSVVHVGPTPVRAVGVTDQHSQVQLYAEGPFDKWFTLLAVDQPDHVIEIPPGDGGLESLSYLGGRTLNELFDAEREGTRVALTDARRPNLTIRFPAVSAHSVGQYLYLMEMAVAVMGELYGVDAFDQPGVEAGKVAAYALMGRDGYQDRRAEIEAAQSASPRTV